MKEATRTEHSAALYIRLSREDENDGPSESVTNQRSLLERYTDEHGISVYDVYIDDGWSGTSFQRPAFRRMIGDIEAGRVDMVITKDLSRLGRDYIMTGQYLERYFPEHRVRYVSLLDGIDTASDTAANDITPFRSVMNDMYARDISKKIRSVKRDKQKKGQFIGGKAVYGYRKHPTEKNRIVVDEPAAAVVRRVFRDAISGMSCRQIAAALNREGVPTPASYAGLPIARPGPFTGSWSPERISEMLQNETYLGHMVQGKTVKPSYKSKKCLRQPRDDWIVVENTHPPLVTREEFESAQRMLESRRRTRHRRFDHPMKGLIFCHECGHPLGVINRKNAAGEDRLYFICRTYQRDTVAGACTSHTVRESVVRQAVWEKLSAVISDALSREELPAIASDMVEKHRWEAESESSRAGIERRVRTLTAQGDQMYLDKLRGVLTEGDFLRLFTRVKEERERLTALLEETVPAEAEKIDKASLCVSLTERFLDSLSDSRETLAALLRRIELTRDRELILFFRCSSPEEESSYNNGVDQYPASRKKPSQN